MLQNHCGNPTPIKYLKFLKIYVIIYIENEKRRKDNMHFDRIKDLENMIDSYLKEALKAEIDNMITKRRGNIDEAQKDFIGFVNEIKAMGAEIFENKRVENYEKAEAAKELERQRQLKLERQRKEEEAARRREVEETLRSKREAEEVEKRRREAKEAFRRSREATLDDILNTVQEKLKTDSNKSETVTKKSVNVFDDDIFNMFLSTVLEEVFK